MTTIYLLIGVNVAVYLVMLAAAGGRVGGAFSSESLLQAGALYPPLVRRGQWWRMITAQFIHLRIDHIALNMYAFWEVGQLLFPVVGRLWLVLLYLLTGLAASALSLAWRWDAPVPADERRGGLGRYLPARHLSVSAGASGAICGLIGVAAVAGAMHGGPLGLAIRDEMIKWGGATLVFGFLIGADNAAHLGGLLGGAGLAWVLYTFRILPAPQRDGIGPEAALLLAVAGTAFVLALASRRSARSLPAIVNHGVALARAGHEAEAFAEYRRAIDLHWKTPVAHYNLALGLLRHGDQAGALAAARAAVATDPSWTKARGLLQQIEGGAGVAR